VPGRPQTGDGPHEEVQIVGTLLLLVRTLLLLSGTLRLCFGVLFFRSCSRRRESTIAFKASLSSGNSTKLSAENTHKYMHNSSLKSLI